MCDITEYFKEGNTAVITGASSGIGRATAVTCASKGMHVWLVDNDEAENLEAKDLVRKAAKSDAQRVEAVTADVADMAAIEALRDRVFADGGACHFLFNNAGVGSGGSAMAELAKWREVMDINTYGPIHGCLAFVPKMKESGQPGLIVNTGSKQGITMPPGNLLYNVSKAALKAYTEGLEHELAKARRESGGKLRAALLIPGWTNTSIFLKSKRAEAQAQGKTFDPSTVSFSEEQPAAGAWMPQQVVDFMLDELSKGRFYIIGLDNDVTREVDNLRMTWTMQDITEDRPPLSRWHPDFSEKFKDFLEAGKTK